jgi:hypothetical protein
MGDGLRGKESVKGGGGIKFLVPIYSPHVVHLKPGGTGEELGCRFESSIYYFSVRVTVNGISNIPL